MPSAFESDHEFSAPIVDAELGPLLERLHAMDGSHAAEGLLAGDAHEIQTLCEITGRREEEVLRALQEIRRERREAELARRLLELEEPLYRVERPSTEIPVDPFMHYDWRRRIPISKAVLDQERQEQARVRLKIRLESKSDEAIGRWALWILAGLSLVMILGAFINSLVR